ncbi:MAG: OmpA family protein [Paludibacter sp.]|nr:OmpA family protein [Paludibacter sp.]
MKTKNNIKKESRLARFPYALSIKSLILFAVILVGIQTPIQAQDSIQYTAPSWYFGVAAGGNINFYRGSTQQLNAQLTVPTTFHNGTGVGLYLAPLIEYRPSNSRWGIMFEAGYDSRRGSFNGVITPCNCPEDLISDLSYLTVEPSLRFAPFKSSFYLYAGPRLAFNINKAFTYQVGINPAYPNQLPSPAVKGDFSNINNTLLSMQVGAGYDIHLTSEYSKTQLVLSPFVSFQPYFGQDPRSIETWNITTLRVGAALKLGTGHKIQSPVRADVFVPTVVAEPEVTFTVNSPENIVTERRVREIFPLRNYVFFDLGSDKIPGRYVKLNKDQVKDFKEDNLSMSTPENMSGRSERQLKVYYNILNILGERMSKDPSTKVVLVGSSEQGKKDGLAMAESVKTYLVTVFEIDPSRITLEGRIEPINPSLQPGGTKDLVLLREGDRRVSIESNSPSLLMEFRSGADSPLKPVTINEDTEAPLDSYVTFDVKGSDKAFNSWSMEITDQAGTKQYFGPYTQEKVSIPGKSILGTNPQGDYKVKMIGNGKNSKVIVKDTTIHMVLWVAAVNSVGTRFSIIYEFNNSKATVLYQKYLTNVVIPKIPIGATVIIQGHTDIIGETDYNQRLSLARANDVKTILENGLTKVGRHDVTFNVSGYGADQKLAPFDNKYPEERFYNRTVIIDIVPKQ